MRFKRQDSEVWIDLHWDSPIIEVYKDGEIIGQKIFVIERELFHIVDGAIPENGIGPFRLDYGWH